jgi:hypothetical protein
VILEQIQVFQHVTYDKLCLVYPKLHEYRKYFFKLMWTTGSYIRYKRKMNFRVIQNGFLIEATLREIMRKRGKLGL